MVAVADVCTDIAYYRQLLDDLGHKQNEPTPTYCDNAGAVRNANYPTNRRTKHMNLRYAITRDYVNNGTAGLADVPTQRNPADQLTKALGPTKNHKLREAVGIRPPHREIPIVTAILRLRQRIRGQNERPRGNQVNH